MISLNEPSIIFIVSLLYFSIFYNGYDKIKLANVFVRVIHGLGCIYYISPLIIENNYQLSDITNTGNQSDYIFVINRSISYFLWDMFALLFEDEEEKLLFLAHHLLTIVAIYSGIVCPDNTYNIVLGILIGEITNPLHQVMDFNKIIKHRNISVEIFYLFFIMLSRLVVGTCALLSTMYDVSSIDEVSNGCIYSYSISIITYILLIPLSFNWSHKKYKSIRKYLRPTINK